MSPTHKGAPPRAAGSTMLAAVLLLIAALAWAGNYIVGRAIAGDVPPGGLAVGRWLFALIALLPFGWPHLKRDWPVVASRRAYMVVMGITGGAMFGTLQYGGLQFTTATNGGLIGATSPVMIALAGAIMFGDRLSRWQWIGLALSLAGAVTIAARGDAANLAGLRFNIGDLMIFSTLVAWAVYSALLRRRPPVHWTTFTMTVFAVALLGNLPVVAIEYALGIPLRLTWPAVGAALYTGIFSSVIGFVAWNRGVEVLGSQRAGLFLNLIPLMTVVLAWLLLGERLEVYHGLGCIFVFSGLWLTMRSAVAR